MHAGVLPDLPGQRTLPAPGPSAPFSPLLPIPGWPVTSPIPLRRELLVSFAVVFVAALVVAVVGLLLLLPLLPLLSSPGEAALFVGALVT